MGVLHEPNDRLCGSIKATSRLSRLPYALATNALPYHTDDETTCSHDLEDGPGNWQIAQVTISIIGNHIGRRIHSRTNALRINDNDTMRIPMRLFSNSTEDGHSVDGKTRKLLFSQMKAGNKLLWRLDTASERRQGGIRLNGFTKASAACAESCKFN
jgi:hypothetical protein